METKKILLVEDDAALARGVALGLQGNDLAVFKTETIIDAKTSLTEGDFDLLILDINLPDGSGFDFCKEIRSGFSAPILFLTANDTEADMVAGFEIGADDYITKPFSLAVLRARVNALLRRGAAVTQSTVDIAGFRFDFSTLQFTKNGQPVELSKTEQRLLYLLLENKGTTMTREKLVEHIWPDGSAYVEENALSVAVRRLRAKLEDNPGKPRYIKTVYGIGYTWAVEP